MNIEKIILDGIGVQLEPLSTSHAKGLGEVIADGELWKNPLTFVPHPDDLDTFFNSAETAFNQRKELAFATINKQDNTLVGSTRFRCIDSQHKRVEIGFTFIARSKQRTHINTEAKYLMLTHAFEQWHCNRVELLTDVLNAQSRKAIARIGATEEGILRSHMIMRDGRVRDSVIFSITQDDWPEVKRALWLKIKPPSVWQLFQANGCSQDG